MEDAQDYEARVIETILEYVRRVENLKHELAVFLASGNRTPEPRECRQDLRLVYNCLRDHARKLRMMFVEEVRSRSASASGDHSMSTDPAMA